MATQTPEIVRGLFRAATAAGMPYLDKGTHSTTLQNGESFNIYAQLYTTERMGVCLSPDKERLNGCENLSPDAPEDVKTVIAHDPYGPIF
jgi:hypothetical protein